MDYILTRVTMLVYVICCVSLFVLFPYYGKNMTVKSDLKPLQKIMRGIGVFSYF